MAPPETRYEYWVQNRTGEIYAVRIRGNCVTGACGPLTFETETARESPAALPYRDGAWLEEHREEFTAVSDWLRGRF